MPDEPIRADVMAALTRPARLDGDQADALLDANNAERALASRVLLDQAAEVLAEAGIIRPGRTVLDLTLREARSIAAALGILAGWWPQPGLEHRPMGDVLKVVAAEDAAAVLELLRWGGCSARRPRPPRGRGSRRGPGPRTTLPQAWPGPGRAPTVAPRPRPHGHAAHGPHARRHGTHGGTHAAHGPGRHPADRPDVLLQAVPPRRRHRRLPARLAPAPAPRPRSATPRRPHLHDRRLAVRPVMLTGMGGQDTRVAV